MKFIKLLIKLNKIIVFIAISFRYALRSPFLITSNIFIAFILKLLFTYIKIIKQRFIYISNMFKFIK